MSSEFVRSDFKQNMFSIPKFVTFKNLCAIIQMTDRHFNAHVGIHVANVVWKTGRHWLNSFELLFTFVTKTVTIEKMAPKV